MISRLNVSATIKLSILAHDHTRILKISMIISFWNKICECWEEGIHSSNGIMSTNNLVTCILVGRYVVSMSKNMNSTKYWPRSQRHENNQVEALDINGPTNMIAE